MIEIKCLLYSACPCTYVRTTIITHVYDVHMHAACGESTILYIMCLHDIVYLHISNMLINLYHKNTMHTLNPVHTVYEPLNHWLPGLL